MKIILRFFLLLIIPIAFSTVYAEQERESRKPNAKRGSELWVNNCARCHNLRRTDEFTDRQWVPIMSHMRIRAGLTGQETRDILRYLQASNDRD